MLMLIFLAVTLSIDSFGIGISYGIRKIKLSYYAIFIISIVSLFICALAALTGTILPLIFNKTTGALLGSAMLFLIGSFIIYNAASNKNTNDKQIKNNNMCNKGKKENKTIFTLFIKTMGITINIIKSPETGDMDKSNIIDGREAFYLGIALSLDSVGAAVGSGAIGLSPYLFSLMICFFQALFLLIGSFLGGKIKIKKGEKYLSILSGIALIVIAVINVITAI